MEAHHLTDAHRPSPPKVYSCKCTATRPAVDTATITEHRMQHRKTGRSKPGRVRFGTRRQHRPVKIGVGTSIATPPVALSFAVTNPRAS